MTLYVVRDTMSSLIRIKNNGETIKEYLYNNIEAPRYVNIDVSISPELGTKEITENGTYTAEDDNLEGFSSVTVNVVEEPVLLTAQASSEEGTPVFEDLYIPNNLLVPLESLVNFKDSDVIPVTLTPNGDAATFEDIVDWEAYAESLEKTVEEAKEYITQQGIALEEAAGVLFFRTEEDGYRFIPCGKITLTETWETLPALGYFTIAEETE